MPFLHCHNRAEPWYKWAENQTCSTGVRHKIFYPGGGYYKGDWIKGNKSGKGVELLPSGLQYEGDWLRNVKHGFGVVSRYDKDEKVFHTVYSGDFVQNKMHGFGCLHLKDGTFYEGEFQNNKRHGFGRCWYYDCSYYEGHWEKDKKHGYGMLVQANGNRYEGQWISGKREGKGVYFHLDKGQKQSGVWVKDICTKSLIEDIRFRQSAVSPTKYIIPPLELDPFTQCYRHLKAAEAGLQNYNEGCQLHKYCYKLTPRRKRTQESEISTK